MYRLKAKIFPFLSKRHIPMTRNLFKLTLAALLLSSLGSALASDLHPEWRALLASPELDGQPVKGVYFFPGELQANVRLYTTHPLNPDDEHWNSDPTGRTRVIDRMIASHVNTVVMSYWSNMPQWSPMFLEPTSGLNPISDSVTKVLDAVQGRPLVVIPAIEVGFDPAHPKIPHWEFQKDFPPPGGGPVLPGLVSRIGQLAELFRGRMDLWARLYDRKGEWRYAIQILHVCSDVPGTTDIQFANAFKDVAAQVQEIYHIPIGFMLDTIADAECAYVASPSRAGSLLEQQPSVLTVNGFVSEVFSDKVINGPRCFDPNWRNCQPHDNNVDNLEKLADWKRRAVDDWVRTGLPVILDVSNGFDGRIVWSNNEEGTGFWGDNMNYTDDRWRNWMSELKGSGVKGITFDTWNGYTEGYAAVPSREHGQTVYNWLIDLLEPDPRVCSHMHYEAGVRTYRVYGAICDKWVQLGADRGFGAPVSSEVASARGRVSYFMDDKAIYWSVATGAHEVHGLIAKTYWGAGGDGGCLGLPVSDEEPSPNGRVSRFEHGQIDWKPGDTSGHITCH